MGKTGAASGRVHVVAVLAYFVVLLLLAATHLAGLWTYPSPAGADGTSPGGTSPDDTANAASGAGAEAPKEPLRGSSVTPRESSPTVVQGGYVVVPRCALWDAEGYDLYYSPVDPETICVQPPGSTPDPGSPPTLRTAQEVPSYCAIAPDSAVYCLVGVQLSADTLKAIYDRGDLQTPKVSGG